MKKLIPAICMTLIAAFMLASSTFAWFSMNTTVKADGMTITAKSDNPFLQIVNSDGSFSTTEAQTTAHAKTANKAVRPTAAVSAITNDSLTALTDTNTSAEIKWAQAFSNNPAESTHSTNYTDVTTEVTDNDGDVYTLINNFKVRLNPTTGAEEANNLKVKSVTIKSNTAPVNNALLEAVRVLIVCDTEWALYGSSGKIVASDDTGSSVLAAKVTTAETSIKVYIFFDGEHTATTTNNATTLSTNGYEVEFELAID